MRIRVAIVARIDHDLSGPSLTHGSHGHRNDGSGPRAVAAINCTPRAHASHTPVAQKSRDVPIRGVEESPQHHSVHPQHCRSYKSSIVVADGRLEGQRTEAPSVVQMQTTGSIE